MRIAKKKSAAAAPKRSAAVPKVSAAAPVETAAAAINAVLPSAPEVGAPVEAIQKSFRSALEKSVVESRAAFAKAKTHAEEATSAFEISFAAAKDGALAINARALEALRANADANFDFLKSVFAAKSLSDVITLQGEFARKAGRNHDQPDQGHRRPDAEGDDRRRRGQSRNRWRNPLRSLSDRDFTLWRRASSLAPSMGAVRRCGRPFLLSRRMYGHSPVDGLGPTRCLADGAPRRRIFGGSPASTPAVGETIGD